jgi:radical SAM protein with 4Fe4S-binding SPASM domain
VERGIEKIRLTGGEPLLRKDIFDIIDLAVGHGLAPCVTTNGLLLTEEIAREFGKRELVWLNVSLEGASAQTNDLVRGEGTFERVVEKLEVLRRHARFTLAFTVMRTNVGEIDACARLARDVGADTAVFRPLYPVGVATQHMELMPSFAEYNAALNTLARIDGDTLDLRQIDPFGPYSREETQSVVHQNYGCGAGNLVCSVSVSGDVNPCSFLGPRFVAANVRDSSLAEIWRNSTGFRAIRALPHSISQAERPSSRGNTATFAGGCRARALVLNGSVNAPDPWIDGQVELERHTTETVHNPLSIVDIRAVRAGRDAAR